MDIVSHAIAGAAVGYAFGHPVLGALFGVLPDLVMGLKRLTVPPVAYNVTHSLAFTVIVGGAASFIVSSVYPFLALASHLLLDLPTHGKAWAPPLLYPWSKTRYSYGNEWEWFSRDWWTGFVVTLAWSILWLVASFR